MQITGRTESSSLRFWQKATQACVWNKLKLVTPAGVPAQVHFDPPCNSLSLSAVGFLSFQRFIFSLTVVVPEPKPCLGTEFHFGKEVPLLAKLYMSCSG